MFIFFSQLFLTVLDASPVKLSFPGNQQALSVPSINQNADSQYSDNYKIATHNQRLTDTGNQTEPWSNAFNFNKTWNTQTDPRTGILTIFIKVGSMISNFGHGPDVDLKVSYNSNSIDDPDELGIGWSWNLTHFYPWLNQLITSTGQNFHLIKEADDQWKPLYHKLKDINIRSDKYKNLIVTHADGLREILNNKGYEIRLEQQDGNAVNFFYAPGSHLLTNIIDDQNHEIKIIHHGNYVTVISHGAQGQPIEVRINHSNNQLRSVVLPLQNKTDRSGLHITYKGHLITEVSYPTGLKKIFNYNCIDAIKIPLQDNRPDVSLCAVSAETIMIGTGQPPLITRYAYSEINANNHNYLGFNSGLSPVTNYFGQDLLFETPNDYTYQTLTDNRLIREIRTYNKYHLLIKDKKISDRTGHTLSETDNFYCHANKPNGCADTSFEDLPASYSLPLKTVTKVWGDNSGKPDISTVTTAYDESGKIIYSKDDYGRVVKITYCPVKGDIACPAMPTDWAFSLLPESTIVYPSKKLISLQYIKIFPVTTHNYYQRKFNRNDTGYTLILDHQVHQSGSAKVITHRYYYNDYRDALTYGLVRKTVFTKMYHFLSPVSARIKHYYYIKNKDGYSKTIYSTIELGKGKFQRLPAVTTSLFTNQILQQANISGTNITHYYYDDYGRLIRKNIAENTPFATSIYYKYKVSPTLNQILMIAANGLQKKIIFDSAGRKLQEWHEAISVTGKAESGQWLLKSQLSYDSYGRLYRKDNYTINALKKLNQLTTTYYYDDMGALTHTVLPDGQRIFKLYNDPKRCMISYRMSNHNRRSAIEIVHYNTLDKPTEQIILPASQGDLSAVKKFCYCDTWQQNVKVSKMTYDGFGRIVSTTDPAGKKIVKIYNSLGEITAIRDNYGNKLHYTYDLMSHLIKVYKQYKLSDGVDGWLMYSAKYNPAGQLLWKANASQQYTRYTYNTSGYPATITTPSGHVISFEYNLLGLPVAKYIDGKLQLHSDYDSATTLLTKKTDLTGTTKYFYGDDGLLQKEIHTGANEYKNYHLQWFYDLNRRLIAVTDINDNKTSTRYDPLNRIKALCYQKQQEQVQLLASPEYDDFSRTVKINYGSGMQRNISYDDYGRRYQVTDMLNKKLLFQWSYTYDIVNNIIQLKQQDKNNATGFLHYQYDTQNNLITMTCNGSADLSLCPRDTDFTGSNLTHTPVITRQNYYFSPLNRLTKIEEILQNSSEAATLNKVMSYHYYNDTPLRLKKISTSWNNNTPVIKNFSYDSAGNMLIDGQSNQMTYNPFNQIISVITVQGQHSHYSYDGSGREVMEKTPFGIYSLFYRDHYLINESIYAYENKTTYTVGYQSVARTMDGLIDQYYEKNYKGDITGVLTRNQPNGQYTLNQYNIYSPYGMSWHPDGPAEPVYKQLLTGADSERSDPVTHWYFLGAGHRTYNPQQHYFVSEDPAGDGYRFAANNPVMNIDPDGNTSQSMAKGLRIVNYITTLGLGAIHKKTARVVGSALLGVLSALCAMMFGFAILPDWRTPLIFGVFFLGNAGISIFAAAHPDIQLLNIVGAGTGCISLAATLTIGAAFIGKAVFNGIRTIMNCVAVVDESIPAVGENVVSENVYEDLDAVIPLRVLKNTERSTNLGKELLRENPDFIINEINGASYLTLKTDTQVDNAAIAFRYTRGMNDNIAAVLVASKLTGKPLNLSIIDEYLAAIKEEGRPVSLLNPFMSEAEKISLKKLVEPFGELKSHIGSGIPADLSSGTGNERFIGNNMKGTFVVYFSESDFHLQVAKYNYACGIILRLDITPGSGYHNVENYVLF